MFVSGMSTLRPWDGLKGIAVELPVDALNCVSQIYAIDHLRRLATGYFTEACDSLLIFYFGIVTRDSDV